MTTIKVYRKLTVQCGVYVHFVRSSCWSC